MSEARVRNDEQANLILRQSVTTLEKKEEEMKYAEKANSENFGECETRISGPSRRDFDSA